MNSINFSHRHDLEHKVLVNFAAHNSAIRMGSGVVDCRRLTTKAQTDNKSIFEPRKLIIGQLKCQNTYNERPPLCAITFIFMDGQRATRSSNGGHMQMFQWTDLNALFDAENSHRLSSATNSWTLDHNSGSLVSPSNITFKFVIYDFKCLTIGCHVN